MIVKRKVFNIARDYTKRLSDIEQVEAVILSETAEMEIYDPYFIIDMDIYYTKSLPESEERRMILGNPDIFETASVYPVDRFICEELPVILNYRHVKSIEGIFNRIEKAEWVFRIESSNILYRLKEGQVLFSRNPDWIENIKGRFDDIPVDFWQNILDSSLFFMEHYLREINVSVFKGNHLLYHNSLSKFIQSVCSYVFAVNCRFEPSPRMVYDEMARLPRLPDEFMTRFETLINPVRDFSLERTWEIAQLIAKSLIPMQLE